MSKKGFGKLLAGLGIGTAIGLAFAPKTGKETREDIKKQAGKIVKKVKDIDLDQLKEDLVNDFDNLKTELKDMDMEKAKKLAKEKGNTIIKKANELIKVAKKAGKPVYEKTAKDVKKKLSDVLGDLSKKLEN